jgi:Protein of unknown function (DUF2909)
MKLVIVVFLVGVLSALAGAGYFMLRRPGEGNDKQDPRSMAWALALRVALSVCIFVMVLLAWWAGWIKPTGLPVS